MAKTIQTKANKTLETVTAIELAIQNDCGAWFVNDDNDRAQMAWWIYNNFCRGDYRENLHVSMLSIDRGRKEVAVTSE